MSTAPGSATSNGSPSAAGSASPPESSSAAAPSDRWRLAFHRLRVEYSALEDRIAGVAYESASEIARLRGIVRAAAHVRECQRTYFRTRSREDLIASKQAEKELDDALGHEAEPKG